MQDKDKMFVVFYVGLGMFDDVHRRNEYFAETAAKLKSQFDDSIVTMAVPTMDMRSEVQVLNPQYVPEQEFKLYLQKVNNILEQYDRRQHIGRKRG